MLIKLVAFTAVWAKQSDLLKLIEERRYSVFRLLLLNFIKSNPLFLHSMVASKTIKSLKIALCKFCKIFILMFKTYFNLKIACCKATSKKKKETCAQTYACLSSYRSCVQTKKKALWSPKRGVLFCEWPTLITCTPVHMTLSTANRPEPTSAF